VWLLLLSILRLGAVAAAALAGRRSGGDAALASTVVVVIVGRRPGRTTARRRRRRRGMGVVGNRYRYIWSRGQRYQTMSACVVQGYR
jgi:hypothetical protein